MKKFTCFTAALLATSALTAVAARAETILSVVQTSYNTDNKPVCVAVRMNPTTFAAPEANPCLAGAESTTYGPDRITKNVYDNAGQLTQVIQAFGTTVQRAYSTFAYSNNGKVTDSIDANGNRTKLVYDGFDRLKYYYYPSTTRPSNWNPSTQATALATAGAHNTSDYEQYGYDNNGNQTSVRRRDGNTINYTFDTLNRQTVKDIPGGTAKDVFTTYDLGGKVWAKRFNSAGNTSGVFYYYDGLGRMTSTTDANGRPVWYQYNQAGVRTRLTFPDGNWQPYTVDNQNRLTFTGIGIANLTLTYNDLGRLTTISRNNSTSTTYGYDTIGRISSMGQNFTSAGHNVSWTFGRNPASQVNSLTATNDTDYTFKETTTVTTGKTYDGLNRDAGIAALSGGYDLRGNLTFEGSGGRTFTYDIENRLLTATGGTAPLTLDYDPEGRLSSYTAGGVTRQFLYDGVNLIGEYLGSTMDRRYLHGTGTDQPVIEFLDANIGVASSVRHLYTNYQGSVIASANSTGARQDVYKYDPYGKPTNGSNVETWTGTRFRYTGQTIIPEAELYYYKARVYDPIAGRFLQTDPIGSEDDFNLYAYVAADPINKTDPTGNCGVFLGACVGAGIELAFQLTDKNTRSDYVKAGKALMNGDFQGASNAAGKHAWGVVSAGVAGQAGGGLGGVVQKQAVKIGFGKVTAAITGSTVGGGASGGGQAAMTGGNITNGTVAGAAFGGAGRFMGLSTQADAAKKGVDYVASKGIQVFAPKNGGAVASGIGAGADTGMNAAGEGIKRAYEAKHSSH